MSRKKKSAQRSHRLRKIGKRLAGYSAAAAATVITAQGSANAAEVVHDIPDFPIYDWGAEFNVVSGAYGAATDGTANSLAGAFRVGSAIYYNYMDIDGNATDSAAGFVGFSSGSYNYGSILSLSSSVGPSNTFVGNPTFLDYYFRDTRGFVGLRFSIGTDIHYGWADISGYTGVDAGNLGTGAILHAFGYNDEAGAPSHPVPEPSSVMLLAAGAAGLSGWRRRRSA